MLVAWSSSPPSSRNLLCAPVLPGWVRRVSPVLSPAQRPLPSSAGSPREKAALFWSGVLTVLSMLTWVVLPNVASGQSAPAVAPAATESPAATVTAPSVIQCNPPDFPGATLPAAGRGAGDLLRHGS